MLVRFILSNWSSFRDEIDFSMVASSERQHGDRVPRVGKLKTRILPVAAIYGGNASGKTNLFKALAFARRLITDGTRPESLIPVDQFRLGDEAKRPTRFAFELLIDEKIHTYSFAVSRERVLEESLVISTRTAEFEVFTRTEDEITFGPEYEGDEFLAFAFRGTRSNQLFLTNAVSQKVDRLAPVYNWFRHQLEMVAPDARFEPFEQFLDEGGQLYATMNEALPRLDTGIESMGGEDVDIGSLGLPAPLLEKLEEDVPEGGNVRIMLDGNASPERVIIRRVDGELKARKLVTYHTSATGKAVRFELASESDGTRRVLDLLPAFLDAVNSPTPKTYVIDEVDRSLHSLLTRALLEAYLANCSTETRNQLLLTTHDILLMDQSLFRRDEMWVTERRSDGGSQLIAFSDYHDIRYDKDIRKSYLQGRLGGIPHLMLGDLLKAGLPAGCAD